MTDAQLTITDHRLVITEGATSTEIPLAKAAADSLVHAWSVPTDYRETGYFVSVQQTGKAREIPACDQNHANYLGSAEYPADPATAALAVLPAIRWQRVAAGTQWNGWPVKTGPADIPLIHAVHGSAVNGARQDGAVFKFGDGVFRALTNAQAIAMAEHVFTWVQAHFDREAALAAEIHSGDLPDINSGWDF
jgi:hypothetical protein